jgi:hypothetical protein
MVVDSDRREYGPDKLDRRGVVRTHVVRAINVGIGYVGGVPSWTGHDGEHENYCERWEGAGEPFKGCLL